MARPKPQRGWRRLKSGAPFYGPLPKGAVVIDGPSDEDVKAFKRGGPVRADNTGGDLPSKPAEVVDSERPAPERSEQVKPQEGKPKRARKPEGDGS